MNNDEFEAALKAMKLGHAGRASDVDSFRRNVWREIRHRKVLGHSSEIENSQGAWIAKFRPVFPKLVFAGLALTMGVAWATASIVGSRLGADDVDVTTHMLDLGVFSLQGKSLADDQLIVSR